MWKVGTEDHVVGMTVDRSKNLFYVISDAIGVPYGHRAVISQFNGTSLSLSLSFIFIYYY